MATNAAPTTSAKLTPQQLNAMQRQQVLSQSIERTQQIFSQTYTTLPTAPITLQPQNVGLLNRFIVEVTATATNSSAVSTMSITDMGLSNLFSNITFTDLQNNQRVNTPGWRRCSEGIKIVHRGVSVYQIVKGPSGEWSLSRSRLSRSSFVIYLSAKTRMD